MTDWPITFKCNNNCISCILTTTKNFHIGVPLEQIKNKIDNIKDEKNDYFGVSGGEPTLKKEFFDILSYARRKHPDLYIFIVTNGRMFSYKSFAKKLADLNLGNYMVGVALYGHNEETHEKITRTQDSFSQTVKGIKNLLSFNISTEVRVIVNKLNYRSLPKIADFIVDNFKGVERVVFVNMKYTGNAFLNRDKIFVRITNVVPYAEQATDILLENGFNTKLYHFPLCTIKRKYWDLAKGVTKDKRELCFAPQCEDCIKKQDCPMIWKTYFELAGAEEFTPIKGSNLGEVSIEISKQNCNSISTLANQIEDDKSIKNVKIVYDVNDPIKFDKARELIFGLISQLRTKNIEIYNIPACIFRPDEVDEFYLKVKDRFVFLPTCDGCLKRKVCCGLSEEYLKEYGCAELRKIDKNYMDEYFTKRNEDAEIQRLKLYYDFFLRYINGSILDAGCGSGLMLKFSKNVFGTDKTKEKIKGTIKERFIISDLENMPFKANTFECVFCRFVLEHLKLKEIDKTIKEFYRILRPNGKIFIEFDNHKTVLDNFVGHLGEVTPDYMENLLSKSGFKLVRLFPSQLIKNFKHFNFNADINSYSYLKPKSICIIAKK